MKSTQRTPSESMPGSTATLTPLGAQPRLERDPRVRERRVTDADVGYLMRFINLCDKTTGVLEYKRDWLMEHLGLRDPKTLRTHVNRLAKYSLLEYTPGRGRGSHSKIVLRFHEWGSPTVPSQGTEKGGEEDGEKEGGPPPFSHIRERARRTSPTPLKLSCPSKGQELQRDNGDRKLTISEKGAILDAVDRKPGREPWVSAALRLAYQRHVKNVAGYTIAVLQSWVTGGGPEISEEPTQPENVHGFNTDKLHEHYRAILTRISPGLVLARVSQRQVAVKVHPAYEQHRGRIILEVNDWNRSRGNERVISVGDAV